MLQLSEAYLRVEYYKTTQSDSIEVDRLARNASDALYRVWFIGRININGYRGGRKSILPFYQLLFFFPRLPYNFTLKTKLIRSVWYIKVFWYEPIFFLGGSDHPISCCSPSCREKNIVTSFPGPTHSPSSYHFPPLEMCLNRSISAILKAMSLLGAWWLLRTEHRRNTALKLSNVSVESVIAGPNRRISSIICVRIWHFAFEIIFWASTIARRSRNTSIEYWSSAFDA